jgi:hypothetical protein
MKRAALARIATVCIDRRYRWSDFRLFLFFCLVLTEVALGKRITMRSSIQSWSEIYHGLIPVEIDGWRLTLFNDCDTLDYCEYCRSPEAESGHLNSGNATELILSIECLGA